MTSMHGRFVWRELMTTDIDAAAQFYCDVVGWKTKDGGVPGGDYSLFTVEAPSGPEQGSEVREVAGLMTLTNDACEQGARPGWIGYIGVDDVDEYARRIAGKGGRVHVDPTEMPGIGRFAIVADPHGATFALFQAGPGPDRDPSEGGMVPGNPGWNELYADDLDQAFAYYADLFGWTKADAVDMGAMGTYQLFAASEQAGGETLGGMMTRPDAVPAAFWQYYFIVDGIEAAVNRVEKGGGKVVAGPHEVPGGAWIIHVIDPQGAIFGLVGPLR